MRGNKTQSNIGVLAFVPDLWQEQYQPRHHILKGLSKHYKVLWVSPPTYVEGWRKNGLQASLKGRGIKRHSETFWCFAPYAPADYKPKYSKQGIVADCFRFYHALWKKAYVSRIKSLLREMGVDEVILYIWRPEFHWAMEQFGERLTCYHIDDEYSFDPDCDAEIGPEERKLIEHSDLVFIHSKTLMEKKGQINPNTYCVPNGVDFEFYQNALNQDSSDPGDMKLIPHPRVGYMGHIKRHIDLPLLYEIAKSKPEWSIVMIGPVREEHEDIKVDVASLKKLSNVHFLGGKPAEELPRYINALDVCLMPYRKTNYTKYIYPMKMHEYFACGKPVVATELDNLKEFAEGVYFAADLWTWFNAIQKGLSRSNKQLCEFQISTAKKNSWDVRIKQIESFINELM